MSKSFDQQVFDPEVEVRPTMGQIDDLLGEINARVERMSVPLLPLLTKKMAEDLTDYFKEMGIKVKYMHLGYQDLGADRDYP